MKTTPQIYQGDMIRALLREIEQPGTGKTQTRRIIDPQPVQSEYEPENLYVHGRTGKADSVAGKNIPRGTVYHATTTRADLAKRCPFGQPGDLIWCRETWAGVNTENGPGIAYKAGGLHFCIDDAYPVEYERYPECEFTMWHGDLMRGEPEHRWIQSIHMHRWASRITLVLTDVRVERLQDISETDAVREGFPGGNDFQNPCAKPAIKWFFHLWQKLYAKQGNGWDENPWIWRLEFRPILANVDAVLSNPAAYGVREAA